VIHFVSLIRALESSSNELETEELLVQYFNKTNQNDVLWAIALLLGKKPKRLISTKQLTDWSIEVTNFPNWLVEESILSVGDVSETVALLLPQSKSSEETKLSEVLNSISKQYVFSLEENKQFVLRLWQTLSSNELILFNKLVTGTFKIRISTKIIFHSLTKIYDLPITTVAHRLSGNWSVLNNSLNDLLLFSTNELFDPKPYPFMSGSFILNDSYQLSDDPANWNVEWKWDGIRVQLVKRAGNYFLWSKDDELITSKFSEIAVLAAEIPDGTVIDGILLPWSENRPQPALLLLNRFNRKSFSKNSNDCLISLMAFDLLEWKNKDTRLFSLSERRSILNGLVNEINVEQLKFSHSLPVQQWDDIPILRSRTSTVPANGLVLKRKDAQYQNEDNSSDWFYWKSSPYVIKAVLMYAQQSRGDHSAPFSEFTFGAWKEDQLISVTKAKPNFSDSDWNILKQFIQNETLEKFGPVRTIPPKYVFEIHFESIVLSNRHKSGIAIHGAIISEWLKNENPDHADSLEDIKSLIR